MTAQRDPPIGGAEDAIVCIAREIRGRLQHLFLEMVRQPLAVPETSARWAAAMILLRAAECLESLELLALHGRERDAAVLAVVLLELQFDVAYIARDPHHALVWLSHTNEGRKPWKVHFLLEQLYAVPDERAAAESNYRHFSMLKHSNPAAGVNGFPVALTHGGLIVRAGPSQDLVGAYLFGAAATCVDIAIAAAACMGQSSEAVASTLRELAEANTRLSREMERRMIDILLNHREA